MAALGNFVWFLFCGGLLTSLLWIFAAGLMAVTVVGIPFAHAALRIASFAAFPFGKQLIDARLLGENRIAGTGLMNVLWFLFAGAWLAIGHLVAAVICIASCVAILPVFLGAPAWALAHLRSAGVSLAPLGKRVVSTAVADEAYRRAARKNLDRAAA